LLALQFDVEFANTGRIVLLGGGIAVKGVVGLRINGLEQRVVGIVFVFFRVVGQGQQPTSADFALGKKRHAAVLVEIIFYIGIIETFHVA
jgi:hypothetical protein